MRDFYFFKRSQYPQLELVYMRPDDAFNGLQKQELIHKFVEIGKVLLTWAILKNVDMVKIFLLLKISSTVNVKILNFTFILSEGCSKGCFST